MKRVLSFWREYCAPSSTCCRHACSGCTLPCSAGSARTSWGWGLCLVLGFYQMGVLPKNFCPGILTRYIWFWDLNQMEDWPSYSTAWWLSEDGGKPWGLSSRFIEVRWRRTREVTLRAWLHVHARGIHDDDDDHNEVVLILQRRMRRVKTFMIGIFISFACICPYPL